MSPSEVQMLQQVQEKKTETHEAYEAFKKAISEVLVKKRTERPEAVYWTEGANRVTSE